MAIQGTFFGLPVATLTSMMTNAQAALNGILTAGQAYSIGGRSFTRANIQALMEMIQELQYALNRANGTNITTTFANMNPNPVLATTQFHSRRSSRRGKSS